MLLPARGWWLHSLKSVTYNAVLSAAAEEQQVRAAGSRPVLDLLGGAFLIQLLLYSTEAGTSIECATICGPLGITCLAFVKPSMLLWACCILWMLVYG